MSNPQTTEKQDALEYFNDNLPRIVEGITRELQKTFEIWESMGKAEASTTFELTQPYKHKALKVAVSIEIDPDEDNEPYEEDEDSFDEA